MIKIYQFSIVDYTIILLFFLITCAIAIYYAWKDRNTKKFENAFVGNKTFQIIPVACSLIVTQISAILILGIPAEFYTRGAQYWVFIIGQCLGLIVAILLFLPVFYHVNSASSFVYLEKRFKSPVLRSYCALTFVTSQILYASVVLYAPCTAISLMVPISISKLLLIVGGICTFYTALGGIKTVIYTDLFQFLIIFTCVLVLLVKGTLNVGGLGKVLDTARNLDRLGSTFDLSPDPTRYQTVWIIILGTFMLTIRSYGVYQPSVQRYVSMPTLKHARTSAFMVLPMQIIIFGLLSTLGFVMLAAYKDCDPLSQKIIPRKDHLLSVFASQTFGHVIGLQGLFISCLFSGSLSTLSSSFNSLAAVIWEDFIVPIFPNLNKLPKKKGLTTFLPGFIAMCCGLVCIALSFLSQHVEGILNAALNALSVFGGQAISVFLLGMFVRWANYKGVLAGKLTADAICIWITIGMLRYGSSIVPPYLPMPRPSNSTQCAAIQYSPFQTVTPNFTYSALRSPNMNFTSPPSTGSNNYGSNITNNILSGYVVEKSFKPFINPLGPGLGNFILFKIYSISYFLICPLGFVICTTVGLLVSKMTGGCKNDELNYDTQNLLHPWLADQAFEASQENLLMSHKPQALQSMRPQLVTKVVA